MSESIRLSGEVYTFGINNKRRYMTATLPFAVASVAFKSDPYKALTGRGEQRQVVNSWARNMQKVFENDEYTPTSFAAGLRPKHQKTVAYDGNQATIEISPKEPLPLTDGGHRMDGINRAIEAAQEKLSKLTPKEGEETPPEAKSLQDYIDALKALPITFIVHLDGSTQKDFVNLQKGRAVDASHLMALRIQNKLFKDKDATLMKAAFDIAKTLHDSADSCFNKQIRFSSQGMAPLPLASICSKGASDIVTSLVGLARVGQMNDTKLSADFLATAVVSAEKALRQHAPELLDEGKLLTPPPDGSRGSATMLIGLGVILAYRLRKLGQEEANDETLRRVATAAMQTLNEDVRGNFSGPAKRSLIGRFTAEFLGDIDAERHEGIPVEFVRLMSASALGLSPLPKPEKPTKEKKDAEDLPDSPEASSDTTTEDEAPQSFTEASEKAAAAAEEAGEPGMVTTAASTGSAPWDEDEEGQQG